MMPEKFPYPEQGWSTGKMRKVSAFPSDIGEAAGAFADSPVVSAMERMQKGRRKAETMPFETQLSEAEEIAFQRWKKKFAPDDLGVDYDYRGAFKAGFKPDDQGHWPDTFKKPNHPTFSNESIYAKERPDLAGSWEGETYIRPGGG